MAGSAERQSAIIYEFPRRGRFAQLGQQDVNRPLSEKESRVAAAAFDSWYHEAAVQESARAHKR
ncbi:MAG TPA: DUF2735 domain-containing protein [Geminicoccus sp.]|uniref:DUF2735 domain-containing protein n=1 Tax=Geminicoccus sp. TaxID=2024832 RepID=UPI002B76D0BE|nr:DUF2735 domain-containing protein [Geminicoccus sp.]HWL67712.1 DUF2735 domain-containing protein [Geminicoccus sp.]